MSSQPSTKTRKKRSKAYYINSAKRTKATNKHVLQPGLKGFMVTCNNREKECVREAYNLLNQHADELYGAEVVQASDDQESEEDVEKALQQELEELKATEVSGRRFQLVRSCARNCLFIRTWVESPLKIVQRILSDIETKRQHVTRYLLRMIPVNVTCRAQIEDIQKATREELANHFKDAGATTVTFAVMFKARNNESISRQSVIPSCAEAFRDVVAESKANLVDPDYVLNVEVIGPVCCISILPCYYRYRKYNLVEYAATVKRCVVNKIDEKPEENGDEALPNEKDVAAPDTRVTTNESNDKSSDQEESTAETGEKDAAVVEQ